MTVTLWITKFNVDIGTKLINYFVYRMYSCDQPLTRVAVTDMEWLVPGSIKATYHTVVEFPAI